MDRRQFLRSTVLAAAGLALGPDLWRTALATHSNVGYGPLQVRPDTAGLALPAGFRARVVAVSGSPVGSTGYLWHPAPDGGACFPAEGGGWIYVSNSEVPVGGGASSISFDANGTIVGARRILAGTHQNCAGGPTPWGTWLSCEEHPWGLVYECFPDGSKPAVPREALGRFTHEAAAVDPDTHVVYMTEDVSDGRLYRFTPTSRGPEALHDGVLHAAVFDGSGKGPWKVDWVKVDDPTTMSPLAPTRKQVPSEGAFKGGEGAWWHQGVVYFTTKGDNTVWALNCSTSELSIVYRAVPNDPTSHLRGVDNVTVTPNGQLLVAEDGDDMELCVVLNQKHNEPIVRVPGHDRSEVAGPAFDPSGTRLYFSSQRGVDGRGITYEVTGPFRRD